jgi:hypothetical protein
VPSRARDYWARESRGQYGRKMLLSAPPKSGGNQSAGEKMANCGIDPHSLVGGVVECRCLFFPSCLPNRLENRWRAHTVVHCYVYSTITNLFSTVICPHSCMAHDLQRHDWLGHCDSTQLPYNSP